MHLNVVLDRVMFNLLPFILLKPKPNVSDSTSLFNFVV